MKHRQKLKQIVIADDHVSVREGLINIIEGSESMEVLAAAENGLALINVVRQLEPELVITDVRMPGMDGIEAGGIIKQEYPKIGLIAYVADENDFLFLNLLGAGFDGIILKRSASKETILAINRVATGHEYFCNYSQERIRILIQKRLYNPKRKIVRSFLSSREHQVLLLICKGKTSKMAAEELNLSVRTIEDYRERLLKKADATNQAGLLHYAYTEGIIQYSHGHVEI
ncbi:MAG: response regulator transcription factor [Rhizobacter sp.]|nr:response regulator transcription factor [Ferruginibacter sp.]